MERAKMKWFMVVEKCRGPAMSTTEVARGVSATTMLRIQGCQIRGAHHINHYAAACPSIQALARSLARSTDSEAEHGELRRLVRHGADVGVRHCVEGREFRHHVVPEPDERAAVAHLKKKKRKKKKRVDKIER
jgi:hypothetical protein